MAFRGRHEAAVVVADAGDSCREAELEEQRKAELKSINDRREKIAQDFKDREAKLYAEYEKGEETQDYV